MELIFNVDSSFSKDVTWLLLSDFDSSTCNTHLFVNFQLVNITQAYQINEIQIHIFIITNVKVN
jgi:hypothetical protein